MLLGKAERACLSCKKLKAAVTGLCRRCYSRLRYQEITNTDKFCERCSCFMLKGEIVREACGGYHARRYMQTYYCRKCGYEISTPP